MGGSISLNIAHMSRRDAFSNDRVEVNRKVNADGAKCVQFAIDIAHRHFHGTSITHLTEAHHGHVGITNILFDAVYTIVEINWPTQVKSMI